MVQALQPRVSSSPLRKRLKGGRNKRTTNLATNLPPDANPVLITNVVVASPSVTLTFDQAVSVNGLPAFAVDSGGGAVTEANQQSPNVVELVYSNPIVGATSITVGYRDPAIRGLTGGYVTATAHTFA